MFIIRRRIEIDMGHRVPFHRSQCSRLHGHRYVIEASAAAEKTIEYDEFDQRSSAGMLVDFGDLKKAMMSAIHDNFDHRFVFWDEDPMLPGLINLFLTDPFWKQNSWTSLGIMSVPVIPTAEELARYWAQRVSDDLFDLDTDKATGLKLVGLTVHETPNNVAKWER